MNKVITKIINNKVPFLFFLIVFILGLNIYKDYGVYCDELTQMKNGEVNYNYVFHQDASLLTYRERQYGAFWEMSLYGLERILGFDMNDVRSVIFFRHFCVFLTFFFSLVIFYFLLISKFHNWKLGLVGCIFMLASPRIFSNAFYNAKDIIFMSFYIIDFYALIKFVKHKDLKWMLIHSLTNAVLINTRILGGLNILLTGIFLLVDAFKKNGTKASPGRK